MKISSMRVTRSTHVYSIRHVVFGTIMGTVGTGVMFTTGLDICYYTVV